MRAQSVVLLTTLVSIAACAESTTGPDPDPLEPANVAVTSATGSLKAVGSTTVLSAAVTASNGRAVDVPLTWTSTDDGVATVNGSGSVTARAAGTVIIRVTAGTVVGSLALTIVDADTDGMTVLLADPLAAALIDAVAGGPSGPLSAQWATCDALSAAGDLEALVECVSDARPLIDAQTTADSGPGRALLHLYLDALTRLLALP